MVIASDWVVRGLVVVDKARVVVVKTSDVVVGAIVVVVEANNVVD